MDNIIDTFNISKNNINTDEIIKESDTLTLDKESNFFNKKKKLIEYSKNLTSLEYKEIFNIIKIDNCQYSSNNNGIFINLSNINEETINKIFDFLKFTNQKKKELVEKENYMEDFKKNIETFQDNSNNDIKLNEEESNIKTKKNIDDEYLSEYNDQIDVNKYLCFSSDEEK